MSTHRWRRLQTILNSNTKIDNFRFGNEIEKYAPKLDPDIDKMFGVWYSHLVRPACSTAPDRIVA